MTKTKEEIVEQILGQHYTTADVLKAMDEYAKQEMVALIENISRNPISCYSQKVTGQDKQYFLGRDYVQKLINQIQYKQK